MAHIYATERSPTSPATWKPNFHAVGTECWFRCLNLKKNKTPSSKDILSGKEKCARDTAMHTHLNPGMWWPALLTGPPSKSSPLPSCTVSFPCHNLCYTSTTCYGLSNKSERKPIHFCESFFTGSRFLPLCSPCSCTNSDASTRKGRREWTSGGQWESSLSRVKQPCHCMCNDSLCGSLITPLL